MQRTGNNIGGEGRRQHNEDDPKNGDKPRMQERLADAEIEEGMLEADTASSGTGKDAARARRLDPESERPPERKRTEGGSEEGLDRERNAAGRTESVPQADGDPYGDNVGSSEGVKPGTEREIEEAGLAREDAEEETR